MGAKEPQLPTIILRFRCFQVEILLWVAIEYLLSGPPNNSDLGMALVLGKVGWGAFKNYVDQMR